jgi:hypothetical protein
MGIAISHQVVERGDDGVSPSSGCSAEVLRSAEVLPQSNICFQAMPEIVITE